MRHPKLRRETASLAGSGCLTARGENSKKSTCCWRWGTSTQKVVGHPPFIQSAGSLHVAFRDLCELELRQSCRRTSERKPVWPDLTKIAVSCSVLTCIVRIHFPKQQVMVRVTWCCFNVAFCFQTKVSSVPCVCWSLRNRKPCERCLANTFSTQDVFCPGWER